MGIIAALVVAALITGIVCGFGRAKTSDSIITKDSDKY